MNIGQLIEVKSLKKEMFLVGKIKKKGEKLWMKELDLGTSKALGGFGVLFIKRRMRLHKWEQG